MNSTVRRPAIFLWPLLVVAVSFFIIVIRRPDVVFFAQPWAEDGRIWMAQIYNDGFWHSLARPQNGYFQSISRLSYGAGLAIGLSWAPLIANSIAILVRCFFVFFILSRRFSFADIRLRYILAAYVLLMPGVTEAYVNITNTHWYLSIYLMGVLLADEPETTGWRVHDYAVLIVSALSGPFIVFIAPALFIKRWVQRGSLRNAVFQPNLFDVVAFACFVIQMASIISVGGSDRSTAPLGFSVGLMIDIISFRAIIASLIPITAVQSTILPHWMHGVLCLMVVLACVYGIVKGGWRVGISVMFVTMFMGFAFARPMIHLVEPQLPFLLSPDMAERYFIIPKIALVSLFLFCLSRLGDWQYRAAGAGLVLFLPLMMRDFVIAPLPRSTYYEDASRFLDQPSGTRMELAVAPPGWTAPLVRH